MQQCRGYVFELKKPVQAQQRAFRQFAGARRFVYNRGLDLSQTAYQTNGTTLRYKALCEALTQWKATPKLSWLKSIYSQVLQQALKDLDVAFGKFFAKEADYPAFKRKGVHDSFRFPQGFKVDQENSRVYLPKIGWVDYRNSRPVPGTIKSVTVSFRAGKWSISLLSIQEVIDPIPSKGVESAIGVDRGITRFAALSNGFFIDPLNSFKKKEARLAKYQRAMSRKTKFSNNWKKAKAKVQRIHHQIAQTRRDFLHKVSTDLSKNHALIVLEDLKVKNMSRSAKGTADTPGKKVKAKSGLNKSILDQGWSMWATFLEYKLIERGGRLIKVPAPYTSQTCPECDHVHKDNRKTQSRFECTSCGLSGNADWVASLNILSRGLHVLRDEGQDTTGAPVGRNRVTELSAARIACPVNGDSMPSATGTHRSDLGGLAA